MEQVISLLERILTPIVRKAVAEEFDNHNHRGSQSDQGQYGKFMTPEQVATLTGYSLNTIYQLSSSNSIPGKTRMGGKVMFETEKIFEWIRFGCPHEWRR